MPAAPDPEYLLAIAQRIDAHADAARADAARLSAAIVGAHWRGKAADAFHEHAHAVVVLLQACADRLADAAGALRVHAEHTAQVVAERHAAGVH
jgi:uncharacterized protein YukE